MSIIFVLSFLKVNTYLCMYKSYSMLDLSLTKTHAKVLKYTYNSLVFYLR